jgi:hypothetical protein
MLLLLPRKPPKRSKRKSIYIVALNLSLGLLCTQGAQAHAWLASWCSSARRCCNCLTTLTCKTALLDWRCVDRRGVCLLRAVRSRRGVQRLLGTPAMVQMHRSTRCLRNPVSCRLVETGSQRGGANPSLHTHEESTVFQKKEVLSCLNFGLAPSSSCHTDRFFTCRFSWATESLDLVGYFFCPALPGNLPAGVPTLNIRRVDSLLGLQKLSPDLMYVNFVDHQSPLHV